MWPCPHPNRRRRTSWPDYEPASGWCRVPARRRIERRYRRALTAGPTLIMLVMALAGCASREAEPPAAAADEAVQPPQEEAPPLVRPSSPDVDWLAAGKEPGWRLERREGPRLGYKLAKVRGGEGGGKTSRLWGLPNH